MSFGSGGVLFETTVAHGLSSQGSQGTPKRERMVLMKTLEEKDLEIEVGIGGRWELGFLLALRSNLCIFRQGRTLRLDWESSVFSQHWKFSSFCLNVLNVAEPDKQLRSDVRG